VGVETVAALKQILNTGNTKKWVDSSTVKARNNLELKDAPKVNFEKGETQKSFGEFLTDSVAQVNNLQTQANKAVQELVTGKSQNLHETMLAVEQADLAFKTMNQIRLKVIDAYKEVMKMQV
jgi:flagellar hook-basal body complex protein FliE